MIPIFLYTPKLFRNLVFGCAIIPIFAAAICAPWQEEIQMLDSEISRLTNEYNLHRAKLDQEEDLAQRLQFEPEFMDEARLAYKRADQERELMQQLQKEIDLMNQKKQQILHENSIP